MAANDKIVESKNTGRYILKILGNHKKILIGLFFTLISVSGLELAIPLLNKYCLTRYFNSNVANKFDNVNIIICAYLGIVLLYALAVFFNVKLGGKLEARISYDLRKDAYKKLQELSFSYYDKTPSGWILARMISDSNTVSKVLQSCLIDLVSGLFLMIGILIVLFKYNVLLTLVILGLFLIMLFMTFGIKKVIVNKFREVRRLNSEITAEYSETILGSKTSKTLVLEDTKKNIFLKLANMHTKVALKVGAIQASRGPAIFMITYSCMAFLIAFGGSLALSGTKIMGVVFTIPTLYLFIDYATRFFNPVFMITNVISDIQKAIVSAERIVALINEEPEIKDDDSIICDEDRNAQMKGDVEFKNVTFSYIENEIVLDNFNLSVKAGTSVALVGHTGSGKSTIVNMLCRFYEPISGTILIDGKDYKTKTLKWLHSNLGYVLQTPQLFSGTIKDNVKYGKLDATDEEVVRACEIVHADGFIKKLQNGYDTVIGESGVDISVGEKQLISFARAIVANPKLIVLDEATSSIDTKTEFQIKEAINEVLKNRTSFIVAHRLSTVVDCDLILVLDKGKVIESGTHKELIEKHGCYYNLYLDQFRKEKETLIINEK